MLIYAKQYLNMIRSFIWVSTLRCGFSFLFLQKMKKGGRKSSILLVWCPQLESRGTRLEKVSHRNIPVHHTKLGCFGRLTVRATFCTRNIFKKPCAIGEIDIFTCFGPVLYEGSMEEVWLENANLLSEISISGRLVTRRGNFLQSHITLVTYYALFGQLASRRVRRI